MGKLGEAANEFSFFAPWPRIRESARGRVKFIQDIRVPLVDVGDSVAIQLFVYKIRKSFAIRQFVIGDFTNCLGDATACEQRLNFPFLYDSVEEQLRLYATQLDTKSPKHESLAKNYAASKQYNDE